MCGLEVGGRVGGAWGRAHFRAVFLWGGGGRAVRKAVGGGHQGEGLKIARTGRTVH